MHIDEAGTVPESSLCFPVLLNRNSFGPRFRARAGDVWRAMQDVVSDQSTSVGWTPERYLAEQCMFVVREMTVKHHREIEFAQALVGRTWPSRSRRDILFTRECRLFGEPHVDAALVASATQEWAFLSRELRPQPVPASMYQEFRLIPGFPSVELPDFEARASQKVSEFSFQTWNVWMDPQAHLNHPTYVDLCDEGTSRMLAQHHIDAQLLIPVAETVQFKGAIGAQQVVSVETRLAGRCTGEVGVSAVLKHRVLVQGKVCALATTIRRLEGLPDGQWMEIFER
jgi:acyl-CoA thioesterase FadM